MDNLSYLSNTDPRTVEEMYAQYKQDANSVDVSWKKFFEGFEFAQSNYNVEQGASTVMPKEFKVIDLIEAYRHRGHLFTLTNPVRERRKYSPNLAIENFDLTKADLEVVFQAGEQCGIGPSKLKDIIAHLDQVYCQHIGVEFMYMREPEKVEWLRKRLHVNSNNPTFSSDEQLSILKKLSKAVNFENFLHTRFPGQKRFSLEGGETLIPALDAVMEAGAKLGVDDFVVGMAHRGRLNVLANIFKKPYREIFSEFVAKDYDNEDDYFDGDVKYHLGFDKDVITDEGKTISLSLCPNPSHLEAVDPVVQGIARSRIDQKFNGDDSKVCPILIHGDAAIAAQGVVYEVVQMAGLEGYKTGGTIHIVVNNQVGFTTNYIDARTSTYCTDIGKVTLSPIFHVNGDDVEAVVHTMQMAMEFRQKYKQDVFVDLLCYRKYGHNEGDEPKFTQPILYKEIAKHKNTKELYEAHLLAINAVKKADADAQDEAIKTVLSNEFDESKKIESARIRPYLEKEWEGFTQASCADFDASPETGVAKKQLLELASKLTEVPKDKKFFRKLEKILNDRAAMVENNALDWGMAEMLSYASILADGNPIRFSGQDVERGTFSHRHAVVKVENSEEEYIHLNNLGVDQAPFNIYNSLLSEYGVLGFEYGYSLATPKTLTIWEAQFGDFFNGAQIMIDQFISAAEDKWKSQSGLVMLLPHGFEGMGAEHSSARLERFLTLSAQNNWQIVNCTTPANFFHVLRRQLSRNFRKPLIVFSPKSLLRHPQVISTIEDLSKGAFQEIIDDANAKPSNIEKVVLCSGKLYYELLSKQEELKADSIALVRLEQVYPLPVKQLKALQEKYKKAEFVWAQEEPDNMGAAFFIERNLRWLNITSISRDESSSPASGSPKRDGLRQQKVIDAIFEKQIKQVIA